MAGSGTGLSAFPGMRGTGNWAHPDERPKNYRQAAFMLFQDSPAVFTNMLSKLPTRSVDDPEFKIFEWRLPVMAVAQDAALIGDTTISSQVAGKNIAFKAGDLLRNERTGEIILVGADPASPYTDLTSCTRGWGATSAAAINAGDILRWVGSAYPEGTTSPLALSRAPSVVSNYTQIFKEAVKVTGTAEQMNTRPMKPWSQLKKECLERIMIKMEYAFLYGTPHEVLDTASNEYIRTTGGFYHFCNAASRVYDFSGGTYLSTIEDNLAATFKYGSKTKVGFAGNTAINILNRAAHRNSEFQFTASDIPRDQTYGLSVTRWHSPFGNLLLIPHPLLTESAEGTSQIFIVDTKYVEYVHLRGRDVKWKDNAQPNNADYRLGYFQAEAGMRLALPEVHAVWDGISAYSGTDAP